jgi:hypothetical protein
MTRFALLSSCLIAAASCGSRPPGAVALPDGSSVALLQASLSGAVDVFQQFERPLGIRLSGSIRVRTTSRSPSDLRIHKLVLRGLGKELSLHVERADGDPNKPEEVEFKVHGMASNDARLCPSIRENAQLTVEIFVSSTDTPRLLGVAPVDASCVYTD